MLTPLVSYKLFISKLLMFNLRLSRIFCAAFSLYESYVNLPQISLYGLYLNHTTRHYLCCRLTEQGKLLAEQKRYSQQLIDIYTEYSTWEERHLTAVSKLTADELSKLLEVMQQPVDLGECSLQSCRINMCGFITGPAAYEPSSEFLQSTGQAQTIDIVCVCLSVCLLSCVCVVSGDVHP